MQLDDNNGYFQPDPNNADRLIGEINTLDVTGEFILQRRDKRTDDSPDYSLHYLHRDKRGIRPILVGKAWLNAERNPGTMAGGKYLSIKLETERTTASFIALPDAEPNAKSFDRFTVQIRRGQASNLDDSLPF